MNVVLFEDDGPEGPTVNAIGFCCKTMSELYAGNYVQVSNKPFDSPEGQAVRPYVRLRPFNGSKSIYIKLAACPCCGAAVSICDKDKLEEEEEI